MKSLQACTSSSNARTQWGEAECPLLWSTLARLRRSPAGIIHTQYKTRTYKNSRKNSMTQLGFRCYDFLLFMLGKGRREEISRDYIETHQRAQHSLESAQCSIDRLCFLFDFLSSYHSLYSVCFIVQVSVLAGHFFLISTHGGNRKSKQGHSSVQKHEIADSKALLQESRRQHRLFLRSTISLSLSLSPKLAAFIRYKLTSFLFFKLEPGHGKSVILKLLNCTFVVRL